MKNKHYILRVLIIAAVVSVPFVAFGSIGASRAHIVLNDICKKEAMSENEYMKIEIDKNIVRVEKDETDREDIIKRLNKIVEESMLTVNINTNPVFKDGDSYGMVSILNSNKNRHALIIEIHQIESSRILYRSGVIGIGSGIENIKLDMDIDKGEYDCIAYFMAVDELGKMIGKAGVNMVIIVNN